MPLQNRVTPYGEIIADPARGTRMGNRGCLHDAGAQIQRPYAVTRWIICRLDFKDRRRPQLPPGRYTALFFLDEATALAAGHRPCYECDRARALAFAAAWWSANQAGQQPGSVDLIDGQLHHERLTDGRLLRDRRKRVYVQVLDALPDGAFVELAGVPHLVRGGQLLPWCPGGYGAPIARPAGIEVTVLTPPSTVRALAAGYVPQLHPSATQESL